MEKIKEKLGIVPLNSKKICLIGMLTALTVILGMYFTVRIGEGLKISFKFVATFLTASIFGPVFSGLTCVLSDILAYSVNPVGAFMPLITFSEFLYGFTDGLFFYKKEEKMNLRIILAVTIEMIVINIFLTSYFLIPVTGLDYKTMILTRLPMAGLNYIVRIFMLIVLNKYFVSSGLKGRFYNEL